MKKLFLLISLFLFTSCSVFSKKCAGVYIVFSWIEIPREEIEEKSEYVFKATLDTFVEYKNMCLKDHFYYNDNSGKKYDYGYSKFTIKDVEVIKGAVDFKEIYLYGQPRFITKEVCNSFYGMAESESITLGNTYTFMMRCIDKYIVTSEVAHGIFYDD